MRTGAVDDLIRRARRRQLKHVLLRQSIRAACAAMAGAALLLVLGTQILDWPWLVALAAASLAAGLFAVRDGLSASYAMARRIDRRMGLHDSLSTALYYERHAAGRRVSEEIREAQRAQAEQLAAGVSVEKAVPFAVPRSLYGMALLALVASSLFAFRYGISRSLDLRPPLVSLIIDAFHLAPERVREHPPKEKQEVRRRVPKGLEEFGLTPGDTDGAAAQGPAGSDGRDSDSKQPGANARGQGSKAGGDQTSVENLTQQQAAAGQRDGSGEEAARSSRPGSEQPRDGGSSQSEQTAAGRRSPGEQNESDSLLDRVRDAMANLLSRMKPQAGDGQGRSTAANSAERRQNGAGRESGRNGSQAANRNPAGSRSGEGQGDQQGEGAQKAQSGPGKQSGAGKDEASRQGQSGIGSEDGDKAIREAEQLAAMGKISEIIGRRSQNLSGDMTVEVASGQQELKTPYSRQSATHAEAGGEVHRDEIPLAYQRYVQQYFDEIRKPAAPKQQQ